MAKAFECWNDSGYYQIDSEFPNLRLVQKGSVYCDTWNPGGSSGNYTGDISVPAEAAVIAFRSASRPCGSNAISYGGGVYNHRFTLSRYYNEVAGSPGWVDYWAFALSPAPVSAGLQVFNQAGQLVFTSKDRPAKVLGNQNVQPPQGASTDMQVLSAKYLAVVQNSATFGMFMDQFWQGLEHWTGYTAKMMNANTVRIQILDIKVWESPYSGGAMTPGFNNYLFLDVDGQ
jgi:hypothetical protein